VCSSDLCDETRWGIAKALAQSPDYPASLAKKLGLNEQIVYYHIKQLLKAGLVSVAKTEQKQGAVARHYSLSSNAFALLAREDWSEGRQQKRPAFFSDFFHGDSLSAKIIVGSPDPHGLYKARARDCYYGIDLSLFLGTFAQKAMPVTKLDTEVRETDLAENVICIGGPITNLITARFNDALPVRFAMRDQWTIVSDLSGREYIEDTCGLVVKTGTPSGKKALILAGKGIEGTKAAILALIRHPEMDYRNLYDRKVDAKVVEGVDVDGDGIVDDVEVRE
jgi:DNA-binding transcriptional ArsR family regulator